MHEQQFIKSILKVAEEARRCELGPCEVCCIKARLLSVSHVRADSLKEAFEEAVKGTELEDAVLDILPLGLEFICSDCGLQASSHDVIRACPKCGSEAVRCSWDKEFFIESIELKKKAK